MCSITVHYFIHYFIWSSVAVASRRESGSNEGSQQLCLKHRRVNGHFCLSCVDFHQQ